MDDRGTQLAQVRPTDTNTVSVYSPDGDEITKIAEITVCNTSGAGAVFRIFHDEDGATFDQATALYYDTPIDDGATVVIEANWWMRNPAGNIGVQQGTLSACTFTFYGFIYL